MQARQTPSAAAFVRKLYANTGRSQRAFAHLKATADFDDVRAIAERFTTTGNPFAHYFVPRAFPKTYAEYRPRRAALPYFDLSTELKWATAILPLFGKELQLFVDWKTKFEQAFLVGDYSLARTALDDCERRLGISLWLLEHRFLLEGYSSGYEANAAIAAAITSEKHHWLLRYLGALLSVRADTKLAVEDFESKVDRSIGVDDKARFYSEFAAYVTFKVNRRSQDIVKHSDYILGVEANAPLIDRYDTLVRLFVDLVGSKALSNSTAQHHINKIRSHVRDPLLTALDAFVRRVPARIDDRLDQRFIMVLDKYTISDYPAAIQAGLDLLQEYPNYFPLYEIIAKAFGADGRAWKDGATSQSLSDFIGTKLVEVWADSRLGEAARHDLVRVATQLPRTNLALGLRWFCSQQEEWQGNNSGRSTSIAFSEFPNPRTAWQLETPAYRNAYLAQLSQVFTDSIVVRFEQQVSESPEESILDCRIPVPRQQWHRARALMCEGEWERAANTLATIEIANVPLGLRALTRRRLSRARFDCYFELRRWVECADVVVNTMIHDPGSGRVLPTKKLVDVIERGDAPELLDSINLPLLFAIVALKQKEIYPAYDRFMTGIGASKPSELFPLLERFGRHPLLFFLSRVCVPKVLARSPAFESSESVSNERIKICQFLASENPRRADRFFAEINDLTQQLAIRRGVRQVESSKIFVDVNGLKRAGRVRWRHTFDRLAEILSSNTLSELAAIDTTEILVINLKAAIAKDADREQEGAALNIEAVPLQIVTISYSHFKELFLGIRDQFVSSNEFGLNSYLSVRIRHGTIEGQVRSSFESANLLSQKSNAAGTYLPNRYWDEKLTGLAAELREGLQQHLQQFTVVIDDIVSRLKADFIRIRTEEKAEPGLFDYSFSDKELLQLFRERFRDFREYEEFIDAVLEVLWTRTHANLEGIRKYISGPLKNEAYDALVRLQEQAKELLPLTINREFQTTTISCLTAFQNDFQRMSEWFHVSGQTTIQQFSLKELIDVCAEVISNTHPAANFRPEIDAPGGPSFKGKYFPAFSDIVRTLMDNTIKHSGANGTLRVKIRAVVEENELLLTIANNLSEAQRRTDPVLLLRGQHDSYSQPQQESDIIAKEGGTGLRKVHKILRFDLARKEHAIDFEYDVEGNLAVLIRFQVDGLTV